MRVVSKKKTSGTTMRVVSKEGSFRHHKARRQVQRQVAEASSAASSEVNSRKIRSQVRSQVTRQIQREVQRQVQRQVARLTTNNRKIRRQVKRQMKKAPRQMPKIENMTPRRRTRATTTEEATTTAEPTTTTEEATTTAEPTEEPTTAPTQEPATEAPPPVQPATEAPTEAPPMPPLAPFLATEAPTEAPPMPRSVVREEPPPLVCAGLEENGATAPLDASGFKCVTSLCCPPEMEVFFIRLLDSMQLEVCSMPHIQGLMHWFSCVPGMDYQYLLDVIENGNPCKYWSPRGTECPILSPACMGKWCR